MPDIGSKSTDWLSIVRDAVRLWIIMELGRSKPDLDDSLIAIDPSVAMHFATPSEMRDPPSIFGAADGEIGADLSFILGAVSKDFSRGRGILLHGHDVEFQGVYSALLHKAARRRLSEENLYGESAAQTKGEQLDDFLKLALVRDRFRSDEAKLTLLTEFVRDVHLLKPERAAEEGQISNIGADDDELADLADLWFSALRKKKSRSRASYRVYSDAVALAHLSLVNDRRKGAMKPVYLVSSDPHLHELAMESKLPGKEFLIDPRFLLFRHEDKRDVRHGANSPDGYGLEDWLRVLVSPLYRETSQLGLSDLSKLHNGLARWAGDKRKMDVFLRYGYDRLHGNLADEFPNRLSRFVKLHLNTVSRDVLSEHEYFEHLGSMIFEGRGEDAEVLIRKWRINVLTDVTSTALVTSLVAAKNKEASQNEKPISKLNSRMPMAIRYRDDRDRLRFMKHLDDSARTGKVSDIIIGESVREKYSAQLISCQLHAKLGDWEAAISLSRMAILLSELSDESDRIFGHEAYYANAVCLRHTLRQPADIAAFRESLDEARSRWAKRYTNRDEPRFELEAISLELASRFLAIYSEAPVWNEVDTEFSRENSAVLISQLACILIEVENADFDTVADKLVRLSLLKQAAINGVSTLFLRLIQGEDDLLAIVNSEAARNFSRALEHLASELSKDQEQERLISSDYFYFNLELSRTLTRIARDGKVGDVSELERFADLVRKRKEMLYDEEKTRDIMRIITANSPVPATRLFKR